MALLTQKVTPRYQLHAKKLPSEVICSSVWLNYFEGAFFRHVGVFMIDSWMLFTNDSFFFKKFLLAIEHILIAHILQDRTL